MLELKASSDMTEWGNWRRKNNRNKTQNCKSVQDTVLTWEQLSSKSLQMFIILKVTATGSFISDISFLSNEHLFFFRLQRVWCFHASKLIRQIALPSPDGSSCRSRFRAHGSNHLGHQARNFHQPLPALSLRHSLKGFQSVLSDFKLSRDPFFKQ